MARIFISYSRRDKQFVDTLFANLESFYGAGSVWYDKDILGGEDFWKRICAEIDNANVFLYLLSPDSIQSRWCNAEFDEADRLNKFIIPIIVRDNTPIIKKVAHLNVLDMSAGANDEAMLTKLYQSISPIFYGQPQSTQPPKRLHPTPFPDEQDNSLSASSSHRQEANIKGDHNTVNQAKKIGIGGLWLFLIPLIVIGATTLFFIFSRQEEKPPITLAYEFLVDTSGLMNSPVEDGGARRIDIVSSAIGQIVDTFDEDVAWRALRTTEGGCQPAPRPPALAGRDITAGQFTSTLADNPLQGVSDYVAAIDGVTTDLNRDVPLSSDVRVAFLFLGELQSPCGQIDFDLQFDKFAQYGISTTLCTFALMDDEAEFERFRQDLLAEGFTCVHNEDDPQQIAQIAIRTMEQLIQVEKGEIETLTPFTTPSPTATPTPQQEIPVDGTIIAQNPTATETTAPTAFVSETPSPTNTITHTPTETATPTETLTPTLSETESLATAEFLTATAGVPQTQEAIATENANATQALETQSAFQTETADANNVQATQVEAQAQIVATSDAQSTQDAEATADEQNRIATQDTTDANATTTQEIDNTIATRSAISTQNAVATQLQNDLNTATQEAENTISTQSAVSTQNAVATQLANDLSTATAIFVGTQSSLDATATAIRWTATPTIMPTIDETATSEAIAEQETINTTATTEAFALLPTTTPEPCYVSTDQQSVAIRVGPGINRGVRGSMPLNEDVLAVGQTTDDDENVWYKLQPDDIAEGEEDRYWVLAEDVNQTDSCDTLPDAFGSALIPVLSNTGTNTNSTDDFGNSSSENTSTTQNSTGEFPIVFTGFLVFNDSTPIDSTSPSSSGSETLYEATQTHSFVLEQNTNILLTVTINPPNDGPGTFYYSGGCNVDVSIQALNYDFQRNESSNIFTLTLLSGRQSITMRSYGREECKSKNPNFYQYTITITEAG